MNLGDTQRQLIRANDVILKKAGGESNLHLVLFDNILLFVTRKKNGRRKIQKQVYLLSVDCG